MQKPCELSVLQHILCWSHLWKEASLSGGGSFPHSLHCHKQRECFFVSSSLVGTLQHGVERSDEEGKVTPPLSPRRHITLIFWHNLVISVNSEGAWLALLGGSYLMSKEHKIMGIVLFVASPNLRYLLKCSNTSWKYCKPQPPYPFAPDKIKGVGVL